MPAPTPRMIAVMGSTASGKTDLAEGLADQLSAQLVNADAFQVYRGLDIGTAKSPRKAEYALIDIKDPEESFGMGEWVIAAAEVLDHAWANSRDVVFVGGTGLYIRALFESYDDIGSAPPLELRQKLDAMDLEELLQLLSAEHKSRIDVLNRVRVQRAVERTLIAGKPQVVSYPPFQKVKFSIDRDHQDLLHRIAERTKQMMDSGWIEEVEFLRSSGLSFEAPGLRAHGYRHIWNALEGTISRLEAETLTTRDVQRYAKRQRTWLNTEPRLIRLEAGDAMQQALTYI